MTWKSEGEGEEWQKPSTLPARLSTFLSGKIIGGKVIEPQKSLIFMKDWFGRHGAGFLANPFASELAAGLFKTPASFVARMTP